MCNISCLKFALYIRSQTVFVQSFQNSFKINQLEQISQTNTVCICFLLVWNFVFFFSFCGFLFVVFVFKSNLFNYLQCYCNVYIVQVSKYCMLPVTGNPQYSNLFTLSEILVCSG